MNKLPIKKQGQSTWYGLLLACKKVGKAELLARLELEHKMMENMSVNMWAEPENHRKAYALDLILLKQDETLIKLRNLTDTDIDKLLSEGKNEE